jgi:hypothetical protein
MCQHLTLTRQQHSRTGMWCLAGAFITQYNTAAAAAAAGPACS